MDSATTRKAEEKRKKAEIRRQIALLQAQLDSGPSDVAQTPPSSPKRKRSNSHLLAPATPSPKRKKPSNPSQHDRTHGQPKPRPTAVASTSSASRPNMAPTFPLKANKDTPPPAPLTLLQKLAQAHKSKEKTTPAVPEASKRSSAFSSQPPEVDASSSAARDEDLALVEDLTLGPSEHTPPFDDPHFEKLEPNSGIRLSSRVIPHEDFQDYLRGRYYISPSKLYSVVRLLLSKQGYDVAADHLVGGTRAS